MTDRVDQLLMPEDVARRMGISLSWLAKSRINGDGPRYIKLGRSVRYRNSAVEEYMASVERQSTSAEAA